MAENPIIVGHAASAHDASLRASGAAGGFEASTAAARDGVDELARLCASMTEVADALGRVADLEVKQHKDVAKGVSSVIKNTLYTSGRMTETQGLPSKPVASSAEQTLADARKADTLLAGNLPKLPTKTAYLGAVVKSLCEFVGSLQTMATEDVELAGQVRRSTSTTRNSAMATWAMTQRS